MTNHGHGIMITNHEHCSREFVGIHNLQNFIKKGPKGPSWKLAPNLSQNHKKITHQALL